MSRRTVKIITPDENVFYETSRFAGKLIKSKLAQVISQNPFILRLVPFTTVGIALIPGDCRRFKEDFLQVSGYRFDGTHRTRTPWEAMPEEDHRAEYEDYRPMPHTVPR
jgi:hypothetical protein